MIDRRSQAGVVKRAGVCYLTAMGMGLKDRVEELYERVEAAAARCGRSAEEIAVVAVSKTVAAERVREAYDCGLRVFGESRVQEAVEKAPELPKDIEWQFIGHLQSNKVKFLPQFADWVQSVDRVEIAEKLARRYHELGRTVQVLLELNTSGEDSKHGFGSPQEALDAASQIAALDGVALRGAMTIGPFTDDESEIRAAFAVLRRFFEQLQTKLPDARLDTLSMGMSNDFEYAIEEGATMIRPGSVLFGPRSAR